MLWQFFKLATATPGRQTSFRNLVAFHIIVVTAGAAAAQRFQQESTPLLGHFVLIAGVIEGALLLGWRLTQLPKTQCLEFVLVSPLRPRRLFLAEAVVGLSRLALLTLSGLPVFLLLLVEGLLLPSDVPALLLMPWTWGAITGFTLVTWSYETKLIRRWGERVVMALVLTYLIVGVLAAEKLTVWLAGLPQEVGRLALDFVRAIHAYSPFTVLRDVLRDPPDQIMGRFIYLEAFGLGLLGLLAWRAAARLQGHFQDLHYSPAVDVSAGRRGNIGDHPLAWWAVKRVCQYSGRVNTWLAGGFALLYAAYCIAGKAWPSSLGSQVFVMFDLMGGMPVMAAALVVLAAVPAAFQYGLWDSTVQERCRRLELLLLTQLDAGDYWRAAAAAAWRRGRGYFAFALVLWLALALAGQATWLQVVAAAACGVVLWSLYFSLGFRAFTKGAQANTLGLCLTVGLPLIACILFRSDLAELSAMVPPGNVYWPAAVSTQLVWLSGTLLAGGTALLVSWHSRRKCVDNLRGWLDRHQGQKSWA